MTIKTYNELKSLLDKYFDNVFTLSAHSTDSKCVTISYLNSHKLINLPISKYTLGNDLTYLIINEIEKETPNETNSKF